MKLIFGMQISIKVGYKLISTLWASKFPPRQYYHHWWAWSIILKVLQVKSLQYLYNISKKKLGLDFIIKGSTSCSYPFWWKKPDVQSTQNRKLVIFCNILRKKCCNCFFVLLWCETCRYFSRVQTCCYLLLYWYIMVNLLLIRLDSIRGISRTIATFKMELFVTFVNSWKSLGYVTKNSVLFVVGS